MQRKTHVIERSCSLLQEFRKHHGCRRRVGRPRMQADLPVDVKTVPPVGDESPEVVQSQGVPQNCIPSPSSGHVALTMQTASSPQDTTAPDQKMTPVPHRKRNHDSDGSRRLGVMRVLDLDFEHVDTSPDNMWEVADIAVPSADEPVEFFTLDETALSITARSEALDKLLWQEAVEDVPTVSRAKCAMTSLGTADQRWQIKLRLACRKYRWPEWREDLYCPGSMPGTRCLTSKKAPETKLTRSKHRQSTKLGW